MRFSISFRLNQNHDFNQKIAPRAVPTCGINAETLDFIRLPTYPVTEAKMSSFTNEFNILEMSLLTFDYATGDQASNVGVGTYSYPMLI